MKVEGQNIYRLDLSRNGTICVRVSSCKKFCTYERFFCSLAHKNVFVKLSTVGVITEWCMANGC